jgi:4-hydroxy-tetrahydrodipicolinate synthase
VPVAVHVGALTTAEACDLARHAARSDAAAVAAIPPSYYASTPRELAAHYRAIAAAAAPLPLYLYNIPSHARNDLTPHLVRELRAAIPAIAGIKDSSGKPERTKELVQACGPDFVVINGSDELDLASFQAGASGIVASGAGLFPELYLDLYAAWEAGRPADAEAAQRRIVAMQEALGNGARLGWYKEVWRLRGVPLGGVRAPLLPATPEEAGAVRKNLTALGLR